VSRVKPKDMTQKQIQALARIVDMYIKDEHKHWEESEKPKEHIYHDLVALRHLVLSEVIKNEKAKTS
jgi:hypothetical protein